MRKLFYLHLTLCLIAGVACNKKDNVDPANTNYTVTVYNGYGSRVYKPGDTVHVRYAD